MADTGSPPGSEPSSATPRRRRWPWILLAAGAALALVVRALLPLALERGVAWGSRRYLGLPIRIDNVDLSLLGGGITVDGLTVGPHPDGVTPLRAAWSPPPVNSRDALLHWNRVAVRFSWLALLHRTLHLEQVTVDAPEARVMREADGRIDPMSHARPAAQRAAEAPAKPPPPAEATSSPPPPPWKIQLDRFTLRHPEIRVVDAASGQDMIRFSLDDFGLEKVAFQGQNLSLGGVSISGPVLQVRRDLIFGQKPTPPPPAARAAAPPAARRPAAGAAPGYRIDHIDIERAEFVWVTDAGPVRVALSLHASNVTAQPGQRFPIDLQLEIEKGRIGIRGDASIVPPAYAGRLTWSDLPFPPLALASAPDLARWLRACKSNGDLKVDADLGAKGRPDVTLSGRTSVDGLWIADPEGKEVSLKWKRLELAIGQIALSLPEKEGTPARTRVALDRVSLVDPEVLYTRPAPALDALLATPEKPGAGGAAPAAAQPAPSPQPSAKAPSAPLELSLGSLALTGGNLELVDRTVKPEARTKIRGLSVSARDIRFPEPAAQAIRLRATLPQHAPLALDGGLRPGSGAFSLSLMRLDLPAFDPYASAAGATLDGGRASLQTKIRLRGEKIQADSDLLLSKLGISLRNPESFQRRFGMPIDLALALLRDPSGNIRLSIPVALDRKSARVSLGTVVASALRQALVGALTAPLKMAGAGLSGLTGGGAGGLSIEPIPAVPGTAEIAKDQSERIDGVARLLASRPALGLVLRGRTGPEDRPGLAQQILAAHLEAGEGLPSVEGAGFFARRRLRQALEKRAQGVKAELSPEDEALYDRMIAAVPVPDQRLRALARERADAVRALLLARPGIEARQVKVGEHAGPGTPAVVLGFAAS